MVSLQERVSNIRMPNTRKSKYENSFSLVAKICSTQTKTYVSDSQIHPHYCIYHTYHCIIQESVSGLASVHLQQRFKETMCGLLSAETGSIAARYEIELH